MIASSNQDLSEVVGASLPQLQLAQCRSPSTSLEATAESCAASERRDGGEGLDCEGLEVVGVLGEVFDEGGEGGCEEADDEDDNRNKVGLGDVDVVSGLDDDDSGDEESGEEQVAFGSSDMSSARSCS